MKYLGKRHAVRTLGGLAAQIDDFVEHYNTGRPHRARGRLTPLEAFRVRDRAGPGSPIATTLSGAYRPGRRRWQHHVALQVQAPPHRCGPSPQSRAHKGDRIHLYVADLDVRVVTFEGELIRHLEADPTRVYQGRNREVD